MSRLDDLLISSRILRLLREAGVQDTTELTRWTAADLLALPRFGRISLRILEAALRQNGLHLCVFPGEPAEAMLSVAEAAVRLGVNGPRVRFLIREGRLPAVRLGARAWAIRADDLDRIQWRRRRPLGR